MLVVTRHATLSKLSSPLVPRREVQGRLRDGDVDRLIIVRHFLVPFKLFPLTLPFMYEELE